LISPFFAKRLGELLGRGAAKYGECNWMLGQPFSRALASLERHLMQFKMGLCDEDHLAAVAFGVMCLIHYQEMIEQCILPPELDDRVPYDDIELYGQHLKSRQPANVRLLETCTQPGGQDANHPEK